MTNRRHHLRGGNAFTLVEMVVAMGIMTVLLLAVQSTIILASRSIPDPRSRATSLITASSALDALNADLTFATAITARSATSVTMQVPDRNGDGAPETITWSWNGTKGAALCRSLNGGTPVVCASNVQSFSLGYDIRTEVAPPTYTDSPETLFLAAPPALLLNTNYEVRSDQRMGQYFKPTLPSNATSWAITRVQVYAAVRSGDEGESAIEIRPVDANNLPLLTVLDSAQMMESSLDSNFTWRQFTFSHASGLSPSAGAALVVNWVSGSESCYVQGHSLSLAGANLVKSTNGATWATPLLAVLHCYIYGTYSTQDPVAYLYYLTGARASLLTTADNGATARNTIRVVNKIQVAGP